MIKNTTKGEQMEFITLNNGVKMPILGYGVFQIPPEQTQACVENAFEVGYRLIDTAQAYFNEEGVGAAIKNALQGGLKREELFITTKLWVSHTNEKDAYKAFESSLKKLGLDYLDLYLIHQPYNDIYGAWRAMSELYKQGRIRAIGVSNFYPDKITDFCLFNEVKPALNQIELHPFYQKEYEQKINADFGVVTQSWASFAEGKNEIFSNEILNSIAQKHHKTIAQVILRWLIQRQIVVIPKSVNLERMKENFSIFDFSLDSNDINAIKALDTAQTLLINHGDPERIKWLVDYTKNAEFKE